MIYIHVPFCKSRCIYCDFFSTVSEQLREDYVRSLKMEIDGRAGELRRAGANTIYFGGGTPSRLDAGQIKEIFDALFDVVPLGNGAEVTMECNPEDVTEDFVRTLSETPVNRISMGVQTLDDSLLQMLKRRHSARQAREAVGLLRSAGYDNISLDLMYGLPGQTMEMWQSDVNELLSMYIPHISAYSLQWEEGTPLWRMMEKGEVGEAPEELSEAMYRYMVSAAKGAGMEHYEISNFAMPGRRAVHNSGYWREEPYVGLGPGAHSYDGKCVRSSNPSDLYIYIRCGGMPEREVEILDEGQLYEEKVLKGLRTMEGLDLNSVSEKYKDYALDMARKHIEAGRLERIGDVLRLTEDGIFVSNDIMSDMML